MNEKDLRIGNLVSDFRGNFIEVESINFAGINLGSGDGPSIYPDEEFKCIKPISLTQEWVQKLGFLWSIQHQAHKLEGFNYVIDLWEVYPGEDGSVVFLKKDVRSGETLVKVRYVHELQNLYHELTGKELIVTP